MIKNYIRVALRNLKKNKLYSFINITGLASGMAIAMLIGLWVWEELSYDKYNKNHDRIAQVWQFVTFDMEKASYNSLPIPLANELRTKYPEFKSVCLSTYNRDVALASGTKKFSKSGIYTELDFTEMMTLEVLAGTRNGLKDINSIMVSASLAKTLFGADDPMNQVIRMDNMTDVKVTGVYKDFPGNSSFKDVLFIAPWELFVSQNSIAKNAVNQWDENSYQIFAQLKDGADFKNVSAKIKDIRMRKENPPGYKPEFFLHPMNLWHLHGEFRNGINQGGLIKLVWLFGMAGLFVLLLACINFMNLSTARSGKRAKEVGIRKTIGSMRKQLILQFFTESLLLSIIALLLCFCFVQLSLPFFNVIAEKNVAIPWSNPAFLLIALGFSLFTGIIAGSYPAIYLSSFQAVKVLKGTFRTGRLATIPRKALVIFQFTVSIILIIGTIIVFNQVNHAKGRTIGYNNKDLLEIKMNPSELNGHYEALRADLINTGVVYDVSESLGSITSDYGGTTAVTWEGKSPASTPLLMSNKITHDYGHTIEWKITAGRDFSKEFVSDSSAMILNRSAVQLMNFKTPIGQLVNFAGKQYRVIGVADDMIKDDPFKEVNPSIFTIDYDAVNVINIKLAKSISAKNALVKIEKVFQKYNPVAPFEYKFVDETYVSKFSTEERIGKLAGFFATMAIFISCLGLFGLASFIAEQRTKEIGVRKVLGATVLSVWKLLSGDFILLVFISLLIASPIAYYFMNKWLQNYHYRIIISGWVFVSAAVGAILITLITVSFQAIKAAITNPVRSLRTE